LTGHKKQLLAPSLLKSRVDSFALVVLLIILEKPALPVDALTPIHAMMESKEMELAIAILVPWVNFVKLANQDSMEALAKLVLAN